VPHTHKDKHTILVVDDDDAIRAVLSCALAEEGYDVLEAADGAQALALLRDPDHIRVVLLDWMMPVLDGGQVASELRRLPPSVPTPAIVVVAASDAREHAAEIGAAAAFGKPFHLAELLDVVGRLCSASARR
jgi:CheY-like chemotaxis protein